MTAVFTDSEDWWTHAPPDRTLPVDPWGADDEPAEPMEGSKHVSKPGRRGGGLGIHTRPDCPALQIGGSAIGPCTCLGKPKGKPQPKAASAAGRPLGWPTMADLRARLAADGLTLGHVVRWARTVKTSRGTPRWSVAELKTVDRSMVEAFIAAGCPVRELELIPRGIVFDRHLSASQARGAAASAATTASKVTAADLLAERGLLWEDVREWGRQHGANHDHTRPSRVSMQTVLAYLTANPEAGRAAS